MRGDKRAKNIKPGVIEKQLITHFRRNGYLIKTHKSNNKNYIGLHEGETLKRIICVQYHTTKDDFYMGCYVRALQEGQVSKDYFITNDSAEDNDYTFQTIHLIR